MDGIQYFASPGRLDQCRQLPEIQLRLAKYFPDILVPSDPAPIPTSQPAVERVEKVGTSALTKFLFAATNDAPGNIVGFDPQNVVPELVAYGEPEAARKLPLMEQSELIAIGRRAYTIWSAPPQGRRMMLDTAICLAVVEYIERQPRELKRKRRVYQK